MLIKCPLYLGLWMLATSQWITVSGFKGLHRRQSKNTTCITSSGNPGTCMFFRQCSNALTSSDVASSKKPTECWWEVSGPVICCPNPIRRQVVVPPKPPVKRPVPFPIMPIRLSAVSKCGASPVLIPGGAGTRLLKRQLSSPKELPRRDFEMQVVGGTDATSDKWPWMGLIFLKEDVLRRNPICGASLISEQTLLTAAHCFLGRNSSELVIRLGEHDLTKRDDNRRREEVPIKSVVQHEGFQYPVLYNDVAVVQLESKVSLQGNIQTVCLPEDLKSETFFGKQATVTGWGLLQFAGQQATVLQELELPVWSNEECQKKYDTLANIKANLPQGISNNMLCAGYEKQVKDSCQGDSGGPLVYEKSPGTWSQIGVVSAGFDCGSGIPGLYTRVTSYLDWIKARML